MRRVHAPLIQVPGIKAFATVLQCVHSLEATALKELARRCLEELKVGR